MYHFCGIEKTQVVVCVWVWGILAPFCTDFFRSGLKKHMYFFCGIEKAHVVGCVWVWDKQLTNILLDWGGGRLPPYEAAPLLPYEACQASPIASMMRRLRSYHMRRAKLVR